MKNLALTLQSDMIYKANFFIKMLAFVIADIIGPIITLLIYQTTAGVPGWSFEEFILFQGSFILTFGLVRLFYLNMPGHVIRAVRDGSFDKYLVKPFHPLVQLSLSSWNLEGLAEIATALILLVWAGSQLSITLLGFLFFVFVIALANVLIYSLMIMIAAASFLFVKSWALYDIFFKVSDLGRYPTDIYGGSLRFVMTFLFPIGVIAFYPAESLLGRVHLSTLPKIVLPVVGMFILSLILWKQAMKKYTSAGG